MIYRVVMICQPIYNGNHFVTNIAKIAKIPKILRAVVGLRQFNPTYMHYFFKILLAAKYQ